MKQAQASRRATRDLVPAFLAAGAVGLVVSVVVGGTTAGIDRIVPGIESGDAELADAPARVGDDGSGISVQVRPGRSLPAAIPVTIADDPLAALVGAPTSSAGVRVRRSAALAPAAPVRPTAAVAPGPFATATATSIATSAAAASTVLAGPAAGEPVLSAAGDAAPEELVPAAAPATVVASSASTEAVAPGRSAAAAPATRAERTPSRGRSVEAPVRAGTRGRSADAPGQVVSRQARLAALLRTPKDAPPPAAPPAEAAANRKNKR